MDSAANYLGTTFALLIVQLRKIQLNSSRDSSMFQRQLLPTILFALICGLLSIAVARPAGAQGIGERIGAKLDQGIDKLGDELQEGWESLKRTVDRMGVQGRVYSRLRWDKHFADTQFEIDVEDDVVILRGVVASLQAKQKALQIAEDTIGVDRVNDELTVAQVPKPID